MYKSIYHCFFLIAALRIYTNLTIIFFYVPQLLPLTFYYRILYLTFLIFYFVSILETLETLFLDILVLN